jgi:hypothetical protein
LDKNKTVEEQCIWNEDTDNSLGMEINKTAFIYKTKEIKRLTSTKINVIKVNTYERRLMRMGWIDY